MIGAEAVAHEILEAGRPFAPLSSVAFVNGAVGAVAGVPGRRPVGVVGFAIANGLITEIDLIADPAKLTNVQVS